MSANDFKDFTLNLRALNKLSLDPDFSEIDFNCSSQVP